MYVVLVDIEAGIFQSKRIFNDAAFGAVRLNGMAYLSFVFRGRGSVLNYAPTTLFVLILSNEILSFQQPHLPPRLPVPPRYRSSSPEDPLT